MKYYVYILKTVDNTLYCGFALDILKRFNEHLTGHGAKYTKSHKVEKIVFAEEFETKSEALKEEYRIKKTLTRKEKLAYIESHFDKTNKILEKISSKC